MKPATCSKARAMRQLQKYIELSNGEYVPGEYAPELCDRFVSKYGVNVYFYYAGDGIIFYEFYEIGTPQFTYVPSKDKQDYRSQVTGLVLASGATAAIGAYFAFGYGGGGNFVSPFKEMELFRLSIY